MIPGLNLEHRTILGRHLTPSETTVLSRLVGARGEIVGHDKIIDALYSDDPDGGPLEAQRHVWIFVMRVRRKLKGTGYTIKNVWGTGYRLVREGAPCTCPTCGRALEAA